MKRAACLDAPPGIFFPPDKGHGTEAKAICLTCPVLARCLDGAVVRNEDVGIWAGAGSDLRRGFERLREGRPHREPEVVKGCRCGWCVGLRWHVETLRTGSQAAVRPPVADRNGARARHVAVDVQPRLPLRSVPMVSDEARSAPCSLGGGHR